MNGRLAMIGLSVGLFLSVLAGCQKPLFPADQARTPYERYDVLRGRERPAKQTNAYGQPVPALRERLAPLEQ